MQSLPKINCVLAHGWDCNSKKDYHPPACADSPKPIFIEWICRVFCFLFSWVYSFPNCVGGAFERVGAPQTIWSWSESVIWVSGIWNCEIWQFPMEDEYCKLSDSTRADFSDSFLGSNLICNFTWPLEFPFLIPRSKIWCSFLPCGSLVFAAVISRGFAGRVPFRDQWYC